MTIAAITPQLQRAQAMLQTGQAAQAWLLLAPLRPAIEQHGQALRLFALVAQSVGRVDDTITALKRICALEGDPPEIVGAIADTCGKAGRHMDAYQHWGALAASRPDIIEAHLNRAVAAASAGQYDDAIEATDDGLKRFPGEARLLATKAMALKNGGRIAQAVSAFEEAVAADPKRALTRYNQAVTLRAAYRFEDSCDAYAEAQRLGMTGADFQANWAAAELEAGRVAAAEDLYAKALAADPNHDEARKGLTRLKMEYRSGELAFAHYEESARRQPGNPKLWFDWSRALIANRQTAEALDVAERGLAANPSSAELKAAKSFAEGMIGDASAALGQLDLLLRGQPEDSPLRVLIAQIALRAGRPDRAADVLEARTARDPRDQLSWSMLGLAWRMMDDSRETWLCDYERLVMVTEVPSIDGSQNPQDYAGEMAALLDSLHVTTSEPGDQSLRGGTQTPGALFSRPDPAIQAFRDAVRVAAEKAVAELPDDPTHPFLSRKSDHFGFSGSWSVRLSAGGHHVSHVHPKGWMSSAYYARLPETDAEADLRHEGWIQFGAPPEHLGIELPPRRIVEPQPGRLVLFPSYMWHGTIPFQSGDRLTAAFDYQPL